ncbi:MAG: response regulator [Candidatus Omnitrophica bacterium]|nr:response regulator [Candidatus Omnitrophota bacterium]
MAKILLVDDEVQILDVFDELLTMKGYTVIKTANARYGLEIINKENNIDLILLDLRMPGMNGTEFLQEMKKAGRDIPVIIVTGNIDGVDFKQSLEALGVKKKDMLFKPVNFNVLLEAIKDKLSEGDG